MSKQIYSEIELIEKYQRKEISLVEFIVLHPDGWEADFLDFCKINANFAVFSLLCIFVLLELRYGVMVALQILVLPV